MIKVDVRVSIPLGIVLERGERALLSFACLETPENHHYRSIVQDSVAIMLVRAELCFNCGPWFAVTAAVTICGH